MQVVSKVPCSLNRSHSKARPARQRCDSGDASASASSSNLNKDSLRRESDGEYVETVEPSSSLEEAISQMPVETVEPSSQEDAISQNADPESPEAQKKKIFLPRKETSQKKNQNKKTNPNPTLPRKKIVKK